LKKRPPSQHLKKITSSPLANCFIHTINRDTTERYVAVVTNGNLQVFGVDGSVKTVNFPNGMGYLSSSSPSTSFSAITVADYTFIVNKSISVATGSTTTATRPFEGLVNVKAGNYGKTYKILFNGSVYASFTTPNGATTADAPQISTDYIALQLYNELVSNNLSASLSGSTIYINWGADFTLQTEDGFNNGAMVAVKGKLQKFADLPANPGVNGIVVQITGTGSGETATSPFDSYYVQFSTNTGATGVGVWKECPAPGIALNLNAATMPHILVREADGTFTFKQATFKGRLVGDNNSNPFPSFVGHQISDVFFYRNRLGFLADEAVVFSESGEYFNFSRTTVTQLLDSDPIDVNASHTKVSLLKHAVPFNKSLLLFSEQTQFLVDQNDLLTPKSVGLKVVTEFPCNTLAKPVGIGKNVYFAVDKGDYSAFREYFADVNNVGNDSMDITGHLPKYVPSGVFKIAAAPNEDVLIALSSKDASALYVYKYFWANNDKLQSSWSKWSFGSDSTILNADFIGSDLYLVINRSDGAYVEKVTVSIGDIDPNEPYTVHLDRKVQLASTALTYGSGYTTIDLTPLGYTPSVGSYQVVVKDHPTLKPGEIYDVIWDGTTAKVAGNITGATLAFGRKYTLTYQLSTITVRTNTQTGGQKSDTEGRLQLRKVALNYADAGYFKVQVTPLGRDTYNYVYSGKVLGDSSIVGRYSVSSGRFLVPVISRNIGTNITITNDSPLPSSFLSADWEGYYVKRSQPV
jgi:hypothetical protein